MLIALTRFYQWRQTGKNQASLLRHLVQIAQELRVVVVDTKLYFCISLSIVCWVKKYQYASFYDYLFMNGLVCWESLCIIVSMLSHKYIPAPEDDKPDDKFRLILSFVYFLSTYCFWALSPRHHLIYDDFSRSCAPSTRIPASPTGQPWLEIGLVTAVLFSIPSIFVVQSLSRRCGWDQSWVWTSVVSHLPTWLSTVTLSWFILQWAVVFVVVFAFGVKSWFGVRHVISQEPGFADDEWSLGQYMAVLIWLPLLIEAAKQTWSSFSRSQSIIFTN